MSHGVLLALKRNRDSAEKAGMTERVRLLDERIALFEAELAPAAEPAAAETAGIFRVDWAQSVEQGVLVPEKPEASAGVVLTPAAQARADELGLTVDDFKNETPSGKAGEFLVSDVQRVAEAMSKPNTEEQNDGDD